MFPGLGCAGSDGLFMAAPPPKETGSHLLPPRHKLSMCPFLDSSGAAVQSLATGHQTLTSTQICKEAFPFNPVFSSLSPAS